MPMGDELATTAMNLSQKSLEITAELIKMLAPLAKKAFEKVSSTHSTAGKVSLKELHLEAAEAKSMVLTNNNFLSQDADTIADKAKHYGIPVSLTGDGNKVTLSYLDRDKGVIGQILQEVMQERMKTATQELKSFPIEATNVQSMQEAFNKNGVDCCFVNKADGNVICVYQAKDFEKVTAIKADFKAIRNEIADELKIESSKVGLGTITDTKLQKTVDLSAYGGNLRSYQAVSIFEKEFGYSREKAILAANKLCDDLKLDRSKFLARTKQLDTIQVMKTNIRYNNDDITIKDCTFSAIQFKDSDHLHIIVEHNGNTVALTPATMSNEEMKKLLVTELGITESKAEQALEKTDKINIQITKPNQHKEVMVEKQQQVSIERNSDKSFSVMLGTQRKSFDFDDKDVVSKMSKTLGISQDKAQNILDKARQQNAFMNNIAKSTKAAKDKTLNLSKNLKEGLGKGIRK